MRPDGVPYQSGPCSPLERLPQPHRDKPGSRGAQRRHEQTSGAGVSRLAETGLPLEVDSTRRFGVQVVTFRGSGR